MEGKLQTSFIPKKPIVETKAHNAPTTNIFAMIAWFIFIIIAAASVGVYVYELYISKSIDTKNAALANILRRFDTASIDHFVTLDARLRTANTVLGSHLAFTALLDLIGTNTVRSVQFTDLKYTYDNSAKTALSLTGVVPDFSSAALQADRFAGLNYFTNQSFSGISLNPNGSVNFGFDSSINTSAIRYLNGFSDMPVITAPANATSSATTTRSTTVTTTNSGAASATSTSTSNQNP